ncbi:ArsR family transcriptional regulator [Paenibacillus sp. E194]|uniref:ArsR/SmtB family transcription factor n=1 Tax=Paenibacillus sp. E194 TaxID=1458845 RepID=UPI0005CA6211|nr:winged helix-turn-helix domain-containing protein [Paenibacillus sp. E194]KJB88252.1 ArsR family transcriptional regulator [Paenibacillus sp. E194]
MSRKSNPNAAVIASLVSDCSRAAMLTVLLDGRFHPASELASMANIKPQTASFHLSKMIEAGVIMMEKQGRHRYYGIRDQEVARVMETLLSIAPPVPISSLKQHTEDKKLRFARTCYDHLAGYAGVQMTESLIRMEMMEDDGEAFRITEKGEAFFAELQIDLTGTKKKRRAYILKCLDWSERRHHLAGALGNALLERMLELGWMKRLPDTRAIHITEAGIAGLKETFEIDLTILAEL